MSGKYRMAERKLILLVRSGEWEVRSDGSVWRLTRKIGGRWHASRPVPCEPRRIDRVTRGYRIVTGRIGGQEVVGVAHRLVWQHFFGYIPDGLEINHKDGDKGNNRPDNLEIVTCSENHKHAFRTGLKDQHVQVNPTARVSDADVEAIRELYATGRYTQVELAERFHTSFQNVSNYIRGTSRRKQAGPVDPQEHRFCRDNRDPETGRFINAHGRVVTLPELDGRVHNALAWRM